MKLILFSFLGVVINSCYSQNVIFKISAHEEVGIPFTEVSINDNKYTTDMEGLFVLNNAKDTLDICIKPIGYNDIDTILYSPFMDTILLQTNSKKNDWESWQPSWHFNTSLQQAKRDIEIIGLVKIFIRPSIVCNITNDDIIFAKKHNFVYVCTGCSEIGGEKKYNRLALNWLITKYGKENITPHLNKNINR